MTILPSTRATLPSTRSGSTGLTEFRERLLATAQARAVQAPLGRGRLIFALDATASRMPTWDHAARIQGEMFEATAALGGLDVQLCYYRGFAECKVSRWLSTAGELHRVMRGVSCLGGETQIERVLTHTIRQATSAHLGALIFVGDAVEEKVDRLCQLAGELGRYQVPLFMFFEASDDPDAPHSLAVFQELARLTRGDCLSFNLQSAANLKELLGAIAVFATGNTSALLAYGQKKGGEVLRLTSRLRRLSAEGGP